MTTHKSQDKNITLNNNIDKEFENICHEEADNALCMHIVSTTLAHPDIRMLRPDEISRALVRTLDESRISRRIWSYGWTAYRYAKWGYAAVSVYQHPWIAKVAITTAWMTGKAVVGVTVGFIIP